MTKQFWLGLIVGVIVCAIVGGLAGVSMVGKKAVVPPSELETAAVNYLKSLKIPEAAPPSDPAWVVEESLLEGGEHYNHHCAVCHDLEGDADSALAEAFNPPVADLTSDEVQRYSDGQLKWIVDNGIRFTGMPGWKSIIDEPTQWKIVAYMRALADPEKAGRIEAALKAMGKWKVEAPAGDHHHGEAEEHGGYSEAEAEQAIGAHHHDAVDGHEHHSGAAEEAKTEFEVTLTDTGPDKISVIKEVRAVNGLGLRDAKAIVDAAPTTLRPIIN